MRLPRSRRRPFFPSANAIALAFVLAGCGDPPTEPVPAAARGPLTLEHDFGVIPHGEQRQHEFELELDRLPEPYVPMRVHLDCSCGHAALVLRGPDGAERFTDGTGAKANLPQDGERVLVRVTLDTTRKEAADLPKTHSRGFVMLQQLADPTGTVRLQWPLLLRFGIEAPVTLHPFTALDFGRVPRSQQIELLTTLRGDERHPDVRFGPAECDHPDVAVALEPGEGHVVLRATCRPGRDGGAVPLGNQRAKVRVATDLEGGYHVELDATWKVVPDLEATPNDKISFAAPLDRAQDEAAEARQYVQVVDHDPSRSREFTVREIVFADGRDASRHFAVSIVPIAETSRTMRLHVRYLGGLGESFRGRIVLGKPGGGGSFLPIELPIELVVFASKDP